MEMTRSRKHSMTDDWPNVLQDDINEDDEISPALDRAQDTKSGISVKLSWCGRNTTLFSGIYISIFSSLGCMIRIALDHAVGSKLANIENPGSVVFKSFFSNILGSYMLGILHTLPLERGTFLFVGLATGLCGSVTTYSKWNQQVSMLLVGGVNIASQSQIVALSAILVGILSFVCSYQMGRDSVRFFAKKRAWKTEWQRLNVLMVAIFFAIYFILSGMVYAFWFDSPFVASTCLSVLLAPFGANTRHFLALKTPPFRSKRLGILNSIPSGTLAANTIGSCLLALTVTLQSWATLDCDWLIVITAIQSGLLASLTTVSTFIGELVTLRTREGGSIASSYFSAFLTLSVCLALTSVINGINQAMLSLSYQSSAAQGNSTFFQWEIQRQPNCSI